MQTQPGKPTAALVAFGPAQAGKPVGYALVNPDGTVSVARTVAGVHEIGGGYYSALVTVNAEWHGYIEWDTGSGVFAREEWNVVGDVAQAEFDAIRAKTDLIGAGVTVAAAVPVATDGTVTIVAGDDYLAADGRQLAFTGGGWPDLTGATVTLHMPPLSKEGTVAVASGNAARVEFELTAAETAQLRAVRRFEVRAVLASSHTLTLAKGVAKIV